MISMFDIVNYHLSIGRQSVRDESKSQNANEFETPALKVNHLSCSKDMQYPFQRLPSLVVLSLLCNRPRSTAGRICRTSIAGMFYIKVVGRIGNVP